MFNLYLIYGVIDIIIFQTVFSSLSNLCRFFIYSFQVWSRLQSRRGRHEENMSYLEDFPRNSQTEQLDDCFPQRTVGTIVSDI